MLLRIRHLYRKTVIYGALLAASILLIAWLRYAGVEWETIAISLAAIVLAATAAYLLSNPLALWLLRAKVVDRAGDPRLFHIVEAVSKSKGLRTPHLAMIDDAVSDAFAGGATRNDSYIFVTAGLLAAFNDDELKAILAHELESIDEAGSFVYNIVMMAFSLMARASRSIVPGRLRRSPILEGAARGEHGPHLAIDKASASDAPAVVRLLIAQRMYNYVYLHDVAGLARARSPLLLVARYDGKAVGFIAGEVEYGPTRWNMHITKLIVDEAYRGNGIGGRLAQAFIGMAEGAGCHGCFLEVKANNRNAISLYKKLGFTERAVIRGYYLDGSDMLQMAKGPGR